MNELHRRLARVVGAKFVTDGAHLSQATVPSAPRRAWWVRPAGLAQLRACLRVARRAGARVQPFSRGRNLGYGSRAPLEDEVVLLDLGRLRSISSFSERLGVCRVGAGVTFAQLDAYLRARNSDFVLSPTGGPVDGSVLGNALERGVGQGPAAEQFEHLCGLEVVLADGEVVRTGLTRFPRARAAGVDRWGVGPVFDGLFSQAHAGVVTSGWVWLTRAPRAATTVHFALDDDGGLGPLVDQLREAWSDGWLRAPWRLYNDLRVISSHQRFPFDVADPRRPAPDAWRRAHRAALDCGAWQGQVLLHHPDARVIEHEAETLVGALGPRCGHRVAIERHADPRAPFRPTGAALASTAWRRPEPLASEELDREGVGLAFLDLLLPSLGGEVVRAIGFVTRVLRRHGFDPLLSLRAASPRLVRLVVTLSWDRELRGADARARRCYTELVRKGGPRGLVPGRVASWGRAFVPPMPLEARLARALDPTGVFVPYRSRR